MMYNKYYYMQSHTCILMGCHRVMYLRIDQCKDISVHTVTINVVVHTYFCAYKFIDEVCPIYLYLRSINLMSKHHY